MPQTRLEPAAHNFTPGHRTIADRAGREEKRWCPLTIPKPHLEYQLPYRDPQRIGSLALSEANRREEQSDRSGQLFLLAEILTGLHRQAAALEDITQQLSTFNLNLHAPVPKR